MEKLTSIEQLAKGTHFSIVEGDCVKNYEYLCVHPHNDKYILALESCSQEGQKLYIPSLIERGNVYIGEYDSKFINRLLLEYHQKKVEYYTKKLEN